MAKICKMNIEDRFWAENLIGRYATNFVDCTSIRKTMDKLRPSPEEVKDMGPILRT